MSDECRALMEPIVPGTVVPNGTKVPGTPFQMDPVCVPLPSPATSFGAERLTLLPPSVRSRGAFAIGTQIRWLDFNECVTSLSGRKRAREQNLTPFLLRLAAVRPALILSELEHA